MRSVKYDSLMQSVLQAELKNIPSWLRITKIKLVFALIAELAFAAVIVLSLNPAEIASGTVFASFRYWYFIIPLASIAPFWFIKAYHKKAEAFKTASLIASMHRTSDSYNTNAVYTSKSHSIIPSEFCPKCGLLLVPGEYTCRSCAKKGRHKLITSHG